MRKPAAVLLGSLAAMLCFGAVASAGIITPTRVSASVSPHHVNRAPYTFTFSGRIAFNPTYCAPGITNPAYCTTITNAQACSGKMSLKVVLGKDPILAAAGTTIKRTTGKVNVDCSYSITTKFPKSLFTATKVYGAHDKGVYIHVHFVGSFLGNSVLNAATAHTQTVIAKLTKP